ncbi:MAG: thymidine phosphorylase family protein [Bacteroidia bacterium]
MPLKAHSHTLKVKSVGIDTYRENIIFLSADCHICKSEGFTALTRLGIHYKEKSIVATLNVVYSDMLNREQAGLSMEAMKRLGVKEGDMIRIFSLKPIESLSKVRAKMYGKELAAADFDEIISDIASGRYSNIELASFIAACSGNNLSVTEIIGLTKAMINTSERINWGKEIILDKHCVGGLPGNRTTPIVVSIVAAAGLTIPKTSSRAITSAAGTADTMEVMAPVNLSIEKIKQVIEKEGGCVVWGGAVKLSPADDILISVERALDIDSDGQMIASVLSKKAAAGSTHIVIDMPVGKTAKIRSMEQALKLQYYFKAVAEVIGLHVEILITNGDQPIGRGIGPSLESVDILSVLKNEESAPQDLKQKAILLAGALLEMSGKFEKGSGCNVATEILESGKALHKFMAICEAQGGFKEPTAAKYKHNVISLQDGTVRSIDCRKLAKLAKLAGAPKSKDAGIQFLSPIGKKIKKGDVLFIVYTDSVGELEYVRDYLSNINHFITIE